MSRFSKINSIYLLIEREHINSNINIYKIGKTGKIESRLNGYPKNSQILFLRICENKDLCENMLKDIFKKKFTQRLDIGLEYFEGDFNEMIKTINQLLDNENYIVTEISNNNMLIVNQESELKLEANALKKEKLELQRKKLEFKKKKIEEMYKKQEEINKKKEEINKKKFEEEIIKNYIENNIKTGSEKFAVSKNMLLNDFSNKKLEKKLIKKICEQIGEPVKIFGEEYWLNMEIIATIDDFKDLEGFDYDSFKKRINGKYVTPPIPYDVFWYTDELGYDWSKKRISADYLTPIENFVSECITKNDACSSKCYINEKSLLEEFKVWFNNNYCYGEQRKKQPKREELYKYMNKKFGSPKYCSPNSKGWFGLEFIREEDSEYEIDELLNFKSNIVVSSDNQLGAVVSASVPVLSS